MRRDEIIVAVVDGLGGGIGKSAVEKLKKSFPDIHVRALGTNSGATGRMVKAGADDGATGENAIVVNLGRAHIIIGVVTILCADSMLGEITPAMARAAGECSAVKILIPMDRCGIRIPMETQPVTVCLDKAMGMVGEEIARLTSG